MLLRVLHVTLDHDFPSDIHQSLTRVARSSYFLTTVLMNVYVGSLVGR